MKVGCKVKNIRNETGHVVKQNVAVFDFGNGFRANYAITSKQQLNELIDEMCNNNPTEDIDYGKAA